MRNDKSRCWVQEEEEEEEEKEGADSKTMAREDITSHVRPSRGVGHSTDRCVMIAL